MEGAIQRDIPTGGISIHVQITGQGEPLLPETSGSGMLKSTKSITLV